MPARRTPNTAATLADRLAPFLEHPDTAKTIRRAERLVDGHISRHGFHGLDGEWDGRPDINRLAQLVDGKNIAAADAALERFNAITGITHDAGGNLCPSDAACNRYRPEIEVALWVGFVLGYRFAMVNNDERHTTKDAPRRA